MVVFTCSGLVLLLDTWLTHSCGDTIKKPKVDQHLRQCRSCNILSCMDCGKDFTAATYGEHNSCISEAQKYQGALYQAKEKGNKGEVKQQQWTDAVSQVHTDNPQLKRYLEQLSGFSNIPRKQAKFINFARNSLKLHNEKILSELWTLFDAVKPKPAAAPAVAAAPAAEAAPAPAAPAAEPASKAVEISAHKEEDGVSEKPKKEKKAKKEKKEKKEKSEDGQDEEASAAPKKDKTKTAKTADASPADATAPSDATLPAKPKKAKEQAKSEAGQAVGVAAAAAATAMEVSEAGSEAPAAAGKSKKKKSKDTEPASGAVQLATTALPSLVAQLETGARAKRGAEDESEGEQEKKNKKKKKKTSSE